MTMDYGDEFAKDDMGDIAIESTNATAKQLRALISGLTQEQAYKMIGITAMIGHNDDREVFTAANAKKVIAFVKEKEIGLVAFWAIQRDNVDCGDGVDDCSKV